MTRPRKKKKETYFLFREGPFRPLYLAVGFRQPPTAQEQSALGPRKKLILWQFGNRALARAMCAANHSAANPCSYAPVADFPKLCRGRTAPTTKPVTAMKRKPLRLDPLEALI